MPAHRLILAIASPVFDAMFFGHFQDQSMIAIDDISAEVFRLMLDFLYTDQIPIPKHKSMTKAEPTERAIELLMELYYCAEKYLIDDLRAACIRDMKDRLSFQNVLHILDFSIGNEIAELQKSCIKNLRIMTVANVNQLALQHDYHVAKESLLYLIDQHQSIFEKNEYDITLIFLIKKWFNEEVTERRADTTNEHISDADLEDEVLKELNLPAQIVDYVLFERHEAQRDGASDALWDADWQTLFRFVYRPAGMLKMFADRTHTVRLRTNRTIAIGAFILNSRLRAYYTIYMRNTHSTFDRRNLSISSLDPTATEHTYNEEVIVHVISIEDNGIRYSQHFRLPTIEFNSKVFLKLKRPIVIGSDEPVKVVFQWPNHICDQLLEYPSKMYKSQEKLDDDLDIDFTNDESTEEMTKCILEGIEYARI